MVRHEISSGGQCFSLFRPSTGHFNRISSFVAAVVSEVFASPPALIVAAHSSSARGSTSSSLLAASLAPIPKDTFETSPLVAGKRPAFLASFRLRLFCSRYN
eukprot:GILK01021589.1.p2 GENE.GILK01021589.1~~GILK01021589.1.p2  ORF type:complete len:102 (-),score=3.16 GILK01021589.1:62-367(-)